MAITTLNFSKTGDVYVAKFTSQGNCVIELEREDASFVTVWANISGMRSVPVSTYSNPYNTDAIFRVKVPSGIEVTINSRTEVKSAKMLTE